MSITRIAKMKPLGIFRDFAWPAGLPEFGRYNLVFGWNWSGKTTLSRMLRSIQRRKNLTDAQVTITVDGRGVGSQEFSEATLAVRVFNRDFVNDNVFTASGEISPIFVFGEESVAKQRRIDELKTELTHTRADLDRLGDAKKEAEKALDLYTVTQATNIRSALRSGGENPYNNYDKRNFLERVEEIGKETEPERHELNEDAMQRLVKQHSASPRDRLAEVRYLFPDLKSLFADGSDLLGETVVSAVIESLREDPGLADWVRKGLVMHKERGTDMCLFCGQGMPGGRIAELEAHFSNEYENLLRRIEERRAEISRLIEASEEWQAPSKAEVYPDLADEYGRALLEFQEEIAKTKKALHGLRDALAAKRDTLFEASSLDTSLPEIDADVVKRVNSVIGRHNKASAEFVERVKTARQELECGFVVDALGEYRRLAQELRDASDAMEAKSEEVRAHSEKIENLERDIRKHRRPAEELNKDLRSYLGHDELQLEIEDTGYKISRHGDVARGLSEGERTAVALLYFLKSLNDERFDLRGGIVVLDDPVSSLDSNAIFSAFGFIKECTKAAGQLFILTHNYTFFREVRGWFRWLNRRGKSDGPARYYMLDCSVVNGQRCSTIRELDPLLRQYESEYHYLFACVYRVAMAPPSQDLQSYYFMPNVARRLLEGFLAFRVPDAEGIWTRLQRMDYETPKKERILRFLHAYSHHGQIGEDDADLSVLSETPAILKEVLHFMQTHDAEHYSGMVSLVRASDEALGSVQTEQ